MNKNIKDLVDTADLTTFKATDADTYAKKTDIASVYNVKGSVNDITALDDVTDPEVGDVYNVFVDEDGEDGEDGENEKDAANYVWNGTSWYEISGN